MRQGKKALPTHFAGDWAKKFEKSAEGVADRLDHFTKKVLPSKLGAQGDAASRKIANQGESPTSATEARREEASRVREKYLASAQHLIDEAFRAMQRESDFLRGEDFDQVFDRTGFLDPHRWQAILEGLEGARSLLGAGRVKQGMKALQEGCRRVQEAAQQAADYYRAKAEVARNKAIALEVAKISGELAAEAVAISTGDETLSNIYKLDDAYELGSEALSEQQHASDPFQEIKKRNHEIDA